MWNEGFDNPWLEAAQMERTSRVSTEPIIKGGGDSCSYEVDIQDVEIELVVDRPSITGVMSDDESIKTDDAYTEGRCLVGEEFSCDRDKGLTNGASNTKQLEYTAVLPRETVDKEQPGPSYSRGSQNKEMLPHHLQNVLQSWPLEKNRLQASINLEEDAFDPQTSSVEYSIASIGPCEMRHVLPLTVFDNGGGDRQAFDDHEMQEDTVVLSLNPTRSARDSEQARLSWLVESIKCAPSNSQEIGNDKVHFSSVEINCTKSVQDVMVRSMVFTECLSHNGKLERTSQVRVAYSEACRLPETLCPQAAENVHAEGTIQTVRGHKKPKTREELNMTTDDMHGRLISLLSGHLKDVQQAWRLIKDSVRAMFHSEDDEPGKVFHDSDVDGPNFSSKKCYRPSTIYEHFTDLVIAWHDLYNTLLELRNSASIESRDVGRHVQRLRNESSLLLEHIEEMCTSLRLVSNRFFGEIGFLNPPQGELRQNEHAEPGEEINMNAVLLAQHDEEHPAVMPILDMLMQHMQDLLTTLQDIFNRLRELWFLEDGNVDGLHEDGNDIVLGERRGSLLFERIRDIRRSWSVACFRFWQLFFPGEVNAPDGLVYHGRFGRTIALHSRSNLFRAQPQNTAQIFGLFRRDRISELEVVGPRYFKSLCTDRKHVKLYQWSLLRRLSDYQAPLIRLSSMWTVCVVAISQRWTSIRSSFRQWVTFVTSPLIGMQRLLGNYFNERRLSLTHSLIQHSNSLNMFCFERLACIRNVIRTRLTALRESERLVSWARQFHLTVEVLKTVGLEFRLRFSQRFPRISVYLSSQWSSLKWVMNRYIYHMLGYPDYSSYVLRAEPLVQCYQDLMCCDKNCHIVDDVIFFCQEPRTQGLVAALLFTFAVLMDVVAASFLPRLCAQATESHLSVDEIMSSATLSHSVLSSLRTASSVV